ncbi:TetR/AcrR family transcriptional regulator [Gorillibacterium sp. CAU 1737]|uniref:TetR/AcrR family transcriptional regulator n=1 Tax=Gorillibacterium sp. CAU 1737 TaxID=3140362 RepID=UPI0032611381
MNDNWHQQVKNKNRGDLLSAAKELFVKQSFLQVSITDVCSRAGVSRVTFYKHFQSMDDLIVDVQMEVLESMTAYVQEAAACGQNGKAKLRSMLDAWMDYARQQPGIIKFILLFDLHYQSYEGNQAGKERFDRFIQEKKDQHFLIEALETGKQDGSLKPDLEGKETGLFLFTSMMALLQKFCLAPADPWNDRLQERFVDMLMQNVSRK